MPSQDRSSDDVAKAKEGIAGFFARIAPDYDRVGPRFFSHFGKRMVSLAQIPAGARVLDVATGKGAVLFAAAEAVGPQGHVTGVDLSEAMVGELVEETRRRAIRNAEVRQMDAEHLQLADASFDHVLCGFGLFFLPRPILALSEMHRVLKPGGHIALSTWDRAFGERWKWYNDLAEAHVRAAGGEIKKPIPPLMFDLPEDLERIMKEAAFIDVRIVQETAEFVYPDAHQWLSALWSHGTRAALENVQNAAGPEGLERFRADLVRHLETVRSPDGIHELFSTLFTLARRPMG